MEILFLGMGVTIFLYHCCVMSKLDSIEKKLDELIYEEEEDECQTD